MAQIDAQIAALDAEKKQLEEAKKGKKEEEVPQADKDKLADVEKNLSAERGKKNAVYASFAAQNDTVKQLIDLALLQNGMLKGEALNKFVKRSISLIK